ncbi:DNA sulfur modification protein DndB [Amylibacter sp.]|nr:DNA sulfur modification protein DndB [Amylibacter sp.]
MQIETQSSPKTLGDLNNQVDSTGRWHHVLIGDNLGRRTLKFGMSLKDFIDGSSVGNRTNIENIEAFSGEFHAQRNLDTTHANGLARYTLMGLVRAAIRTIDGSVDEKILKLRDQLGDPAYVSLQPVVCNIRTCSPNGTDLKIRDVGEGRSLETGAYQVMIGAKQLMWVVDGQHRREGFNRVLEFLRKVNQMYKYPAKGLFVPSGYNGDIIDLSIHNFWAKILEIALTQATITIECHLGLKEDEEQQLFYDLNSKGKKVIQSLAYQYDHTDPINKFISEEIVEGNLLGFKPSEKDVSDWQNDDGSISRKDVNTITCLLTLGKSNSKSATPAIVDTRRDYIKRFWKLVTTTSGFGEDKAKSKTILAQPVMLKALAKLAFDLAHGHQNIRNDADYKKLCNAIVSKELDFTHQNPLWRALLMPSEDREKEFSGISEYVYVPVDTNLDAGTYDKTNEWVRFGSRHNDIYPRLGDTIRYSLKLKPRPSITKVLAKMKLNE